MTSTALNESGDGRPIVAIVGSTIMEFVGDKQDQAREACQQLGQALCTNGLRIAVFSGKPTEVLSPLPERPPLELLPEASIEADVVKGYLSVASIPNNSILCFHPIAFEASFAEFVSHRDAFQRGHSQSSDPTLSFYLSLEAVDGALLVGGSSMTRLAAHRMQERSCPVLAVAEFGGAAKAIVAGLRESKTREAGVARWLPKSANERVVTLRKQILDQRTLREKERQVSVRRRDNEDRTRRGIRLAWLCLSAAVVLLVTPWIERVPTWLYVLLIFTGGCAAGTVGATVRMLTIDAPRAKEGTPPLFGALVGFISALFYLTSQLSTNTNFDLQSSPVTFLFAVALAVASGFGFDVTLSRLRTRLTNSGEGVLGEATANQDES